LHILPESDSEDDLSDHTPPSGPTKRNGTFRRPIKITLEKPQRALHKFMKPSKVNWRNNSRAKHLLESHSSFFEKNTEREVLDDIRLGFSNYYSRQGIVPRESSMKQKERDSLAKKKVNSEEQSF
jgi:hypothetical protein